MLKDISHSGGTRNTTEILFSTPFDYMFPDLARSAHCLLPPGQDTTRALLELGDAMADPEGEALDSNVPSVFTYLGQFIDHDLTARTDRETEVSEIFAPDGNALPIEPRAPGHVAATLKNGRRPQLDLDSVYGDGPGLVAQSATEAQALYDAELMLELQQGSTIDLPRDGRQARIADMRNDENINVSQLHAAFLAFHNAVMAGLYAENNGTGPIGYVRARQLVRWCYQYAVVQDYLKMVCDPVVVEDVLKNGPTFFGPVSGGLPLFMPLEFSVAAFRFGHSMVRPSYQLKGTNAKIEEILGVSTATRPGGQEDLLEASGGGYRVKEKFGVDWSRFVGSGAENKARKLHTAIARGLFQLTFEGAPGRVLSHLAQRNLLRGFSLSIPTGQAVSAALGIEPLSPGEILDGENDGIREALTRGGFDQRTPLWYYVLREAAVQQDGQCLGAVGSRIVAETIVGLLKADPNSYINQRSVSHAIHKRGIEVPTDKGRKRVASMADMLKIAGVH